MSNFVRTCRRAALCAVLLVVPGAPLAVAAPLEQAASSTSATIGRDDVLARFAGCADGVVRTLFADGADPLNSSARAYFWGCVFGEGWPDRPLTDDLAHHERMVESILAGGGLDTALTLSVELARAGGVIGPSSSDITSRHTACYSWVSVYAVARYAMIPAAAEGLALPDYSLCD